MYYLRHRYYNPVTGRFLSADPLANEGQRRYEYAGADPVNGFDPTGNEAIVEWALINNYPGRIPFISVHFPTYCGIGDGGSLAACSPPSPGAPPPPPPPPPPCKCGIKTPPEYNVAGSVRAYRLENGYMGYYFNWHASFLNGAPYNPECCEVRQLISWNRGDRPHRGFAPPRNQPNQWYEDRDENNKRYGRRTGPYSDLHPNFDYYSDNRYEGNDTPQQFPPGTILSFRLIVVDVCNGSNTIFTSKTLKVIF